MQADVLRAEDELTQAIVSNDADAIARLLDDDWVIIDPDGGIIEKARFLDVVRSGALVHQSMESDEARARMYGDAAVLTALVSTKATYMGHAFETHERATDVFVKKGERWSCVLSQLTRFNKK